MLLMFKIMSFLVYFHPLTSDPMFNSQEWEGGGRGKSLVYVKNEVFLK